MKCIKMKPMYKYLLYTICFCCIVIPFFSIAYKLDLVLLGGDDAVTQHYPAMLYVSRVVKKFIRAITSGEKFIFPMYEWTLGMGENTIATLNWYGFTDPFYWLAGFFTEEQLPYFYSFFFYARVYLGGLACIALLHEINNKKSDMAYVLAALVYSFTGFTLQCNIHIIFTHAMAYIPMMLLGTERNLKGKRRGVLAVSVFLFALSGFFFLYIASIAIAVYTLYRLIVQREKIKKACLQIGKLLGEYIVGLGLAAIVFIPEIMGFLSSSRNGLIKVDTIFMNFKEIEELLCNLFLPQANNQQVLSICTIGVISIIWIVLAKRMKIQKISIGLLFLSVIMPPITLIMTGFAAEYDRWQVVITLYIAYLTMEMWDSIEDTTWLQKMGLVSVYMVLMLYGKWADELNEYKYSRTLLIYGIILVFICLVIPFVKRMGRKDWVKVTKVVFFMVLIWTIYLSWKEVTRDREIESVRQYDIVEELIPEDDGYYRVDYEKTFSEPRLGMNISFMLEYMGISEYFSIENESYMNAFAEWEAYYKSFNNGGLDQRTILETTAAVKYFIAKKENNFIVPYGFEKIKISKDGEWELWENQYALPMVYTYESILDEKIYDEMNGLEKQQVLLQAAAITDYDGNITKQETIDNQIEKGTYTVEDLQNGTIKDGIVSVEAGTVMTILADLRADCENYLYFEDDMKVCVEIRENYMKYREPITLGRVEEDRKQKISIIFEENAIFSLDDMNIFYYDFANYAKYIENMQEGIINDSIVIGTNRLECEVLLEKPRILCIATPYSEGWHATIDGQKVEIFEINSMYMGIEVPEGSHEITFEFLTPGIQVGGWISLCTFAGVIMYYIWKRHKKAIDLADCENIQL